MTQPGGRHQRMTRYFTGSHPRLFAHRGASGQAPENTFAAFHHAAAVGVEYAELDVHMSRDGQIVVIHDETLDRTTNGQGKVRDLTVAELQRFDAGYWFSTDERQTFPFRGTGVTIPTLMDTLRSFPTLKFTIEIKEDITLIADQVIAVIHACGRAEDVLLASLHDRIMAHVRASAPDIASSLSVGETLEFYQRCLSRQLTGYRPPGQALQVPLEHEGLPLVTQETVATAHALGGEVHVWTVNDPQEMERLFALGVDGLISDFPDRLLAAAKQRQS